MKHKNILIPEIIASAYTQLKLIAQLQNIKTTSMESFKIRSKERKIFGKRS